MQKSLVYLLFGFIFLNFSFGDVIEMDEFLLKSNHIINKHRFVYLQTLEHANDAKLLIDMNIQKKNSDGKAKFFIYIFPNNEDQYDELINGKCCIDKNDYCENEDQEITFQHSVDAEEFFYIKEIDLNNQTADVKEKLIVGQDGVYYTLFVFCADVLNQTSTRILFSNVEVSKDIYAEINGELIYQNSFGYLSGELYPLTSYFFVLLIIYVVGLSVWLFLIWKYRQYLIKLQHFITFLLCVSTLEFLFSYVQYQDYNSRGYRSIALLVIFILLNVLRNSFARTITLLVSMGYGITKPYVDRKKGKIASLTFLYILASLMYIGISYLNLYKPVSKGILIFVAMPIAIVNTIFFYWIMSELAKTYHELKTKDQQIKLKMIKKLISVLGVAALFGCIVICMTFYYKYILKRDEIWKIIWFFEGVWAAIFTVILYTICVIMRPSSNSKLLAYSEELIDESNTNEDENNQSGRDIRELTDDLDKSPTGLKQFPKEEDDQEEQKKEEEEVKS